MSESNAEFGPAVEQSEREKARETIARQRQELGRRRETGELSQEDFPLDEADEINRDGYPLMQLHLGDRPLVISKAELDMRGPIQVLLKTPSGAISDWLDAESMPHYDDGDLIIIFPDELDNESLIQ